MANGHADGIRMRRDVWKLADWDPTLLWYARAVAEMRTRPIADFDSWRYQAAIHGYDPDQDPFFDGGGPLPSTPVQKDFWSKCQHSSWFFLPWHRMYLTYFERIVQAAIVKLGGPADWALPYWNYSDAANANARKLPPAFRAEQLPDGSDNALYVAQRDPDMLAGEDMSSTAIGLRCLKDTLFTGSGNGSSAGFGGPKTIFSHLGDVTGSLEATPHGDVHMAVGGAGAGGWMTSFETAALDPIFWLHHCNIDRLWEVWRLRNAGFINPSDPDWRKATGALFQLHDADGKVVTVTPAQAEDTTAEPLNYEYEDVSDPWASATAFGIAAKGVAVTEPAHPAELVGATGGVDLTQKATSVNLSIAAPKGPLVAALAAGHTPRIYLNLENVTGTGSLGSYAVYLNVPAGSADPHAHPELFAGTLPMFGVKEASRPGGVHGGGGLTYVLDATDVVNHLKIKGDWDPDNLNVTLAPVSASAAAGAKARVGRISLFYH